MDYEESSRAFNLIAGLVLGVLSGVGATLLLAPRGGRLDRRVRAVAGASRERGRRGARRLSLRRARGERGVAGWLPR